jgi:hypothetical protein
VKPTSLVRPSLGIESLYSTKPAGRLVPAISDIPGSFVDTRYGPKDVHCGRLYHATDDPRRHAYAHVQPWQKLSNSWLWQVHHPH